MAKVGRNDSCPCGSDKKYKKCCAGQVAASSDEHGFDALLDGFRKLYPDVEIKAEGSKEIKMSEVILEFADEFASLTKNDTQYRSLLKWAVLAWNLGLISNSEDELDEMIEDRLHDLFREGSDEWCSTFALVKSLALKKQEEYSHINRLIIDCEFSTGYMFDILSISRLAH